MTDDHLKIYVDATRLTTLNDGVGSQTDFTNWKRPSLLVGGRCP